ncbi:CaiB/BaiF CoA transferase family protein [Halomonas mongoliensis]|uniref:CaiB/BaiF CoA transferase family protein n=1 Tax=Halomonas mongoliensis TaxID=321265 RepID=UPI00403B1528
MGPLNGVKVIEIQGLGPAPFCGMMLADMGADVVSVTRLDSGGGQRVSERGKRSIALNLKQPRGIELLLELCEGADILIEGFRPGVAEKLGFGPDACHSRNPALVYGRMTGWGQSGPLAGTAGHDINYIALSGALHAIGRKGERPVVPLNLVGDFGGGGMMLAFGVACALLEARQSGVGQVVDASMVEGSALLMSMMYGFKAAGNWHDERESNLLDGAAHFYDTYETRDGKYVAVGAIEPQFYRLLLEAVGVDPEALGEQRNRATWSKGRDVLEKIFLQKTRDEWCELFEGSDACISPVLSMSEAPEHPHNRARDTFIELDGILQPAPAPRFSRTPPEVLHGSRTAGADTDKILAELGYDVERRTVLSAEGIIRHLVPDA